MYIAKAYIRVQEKTLRAKIIKSVPFLFTPQKTPFYVFEKGYTNSISDINFFVKGRNIGRENKVTLEEYLYCNAYSPNGTEEEAVRLFLKLAQMSEDNADSLPVLYKGEVYDSWMDTPFETEEDFKSIKTLSPLEVAQAFKDGRIEL